MNDAELDGDGSASAGPIDHIVVPPTGLPSASVHRNAAPPQSCTSMPRCRSYQACAAFGSFALKKMPPIPVTRCMCTSHGRMKGEPIHVQRSAPARQVLQAGLCFESSRLDSGRKGFVVAFVLVGVGDGEVGDRAIEVTSLAEVGGDGDPVAPACVG